MFAFFLWLCFLEAIAEIAIYSFVYSCSDRKKYIFTAIAVREVIEYFVPGIQ